LPPLPPHLLGIQQLNVQNPEGWPVPSPAQSKAYIFQQEHGEEVVAAVLKALLPYYQGLRGVWADSHDSAKLNEIMPEITDFKDLINLSQVHVHSWQKSDFAYVGLGFGCSWDREHALGVMLHQARVVEIGGADVSFAWEPDEADH
jgi:hypothetical protein